MVNCQFPVILLSPFRNIFPHPYNSIVNMTHIRSIAVRLTITFSAFTLFVLLSTGSFAQDGKALFSQNCASCHAVHKQLTGPALAGVEDRWSEKKNLYAWIRNSQAFLKTGDKYANDLYQQYNKTQMNAFPALTDADIDAILAYITNQRNEM